MLELVKDDLIDAGKDFRDCFSRQSRFTDQFSDKIVLDTVVGANSFATVVCGGDGLGEGRSLLEGTP